MDIKAFEDLPLRRYPTNGEKFRNELEGYLSGLAENGRIYIGFIERAFNKLCYRTAIFTELGVPMQCHVIRSSEAGVVNYPSSEKSLAKSAAPRFAQLAEEGWIFSGSFPKTIGASKETFWVFYKKPAQ